jgi:hypothetical protein
MNRVSVNGQAKGQPVRLKVRKPKAHPQRKLALAVGGVGTFVLLLSVWDCTAALHDLTGLPYVLAALLAVGIDLGMVVSEMAAVISEKGKDAHRWAERYVRLAVGLSVLLNGAAAAGHARGWLVAVAVPVGGVVPAFVYIAGRTAGSLYTGK